MKRSLVALATLFALGTSCKKPATDGADASATATGPKITVQGTQVLLNGEVTGTTRAIEDLGRMQKLDELFDRMKKDRELFKAQNPDKPFPGEAVISVDPTTPAVVFKSIFQTAAYAGYPFLSMDTGGSQLVRVDAVIPRPPGEDLPPRAALHVRISDDKGVELEEKRDSAVIVQRVIANTGDADLQNRVKTALVDTILRRDLRTDSVVSVIVHVENRLPFSKLAPVLLGLRDAQARLAGPKDPDGAFSPQLAVN